jgi:TRAP-type uncharacterized transport system fused permease subunit
LYESFSKNSLKTLTIRTEQQQKTSGECPRREKLSLSNGGSFLREGSRRPLSSFWKILVTCIALALAAFEIYTAPFGTLDSLLQRAMFVSFVLGLTFICFTFTAKTKSNKVPFYDLILAALGFSSGGYILLNGERIVTRWVGVDPMGPGDIFFTAVVVILVLEVTRRTVGPALLGIIALFIAYTFIGDLMPGEFGHRGMTLIGFLDRMVYTFDGILGTPTGVTCTYVYMFILFGQVFNEAGGGTFFFRLASAIAGRMVGGPAKMAVECGDYRKLHDTPHETFRLQLYFRRRS